MPRPSPQIGLIVIPLAAVALLLAGAPLTRLDTALIDAPISTSDIPALYNSPADSTTREQVRWLKADLRLIERREREIAASSKAYSKTPTTANKQLSRDAREAYSHAVDGYNYYASKSCSMAALREAGAPRKFVADSSNYVAVEERTEMWK
ncbi:MAG TPA: hypothetical protein VGK19_18400 [Capsulimonadaceae bacterium]|jgi:hypothetical protein